MKKNKKKLLRQVQKLEFWTVLLYVKNADTRIWIENII